MYESSLAKEMIEKDFWNPSDAVYAWVAALEAAGVDSWEGFDEARQIFKDNIQNIKDEYVQANA